MTPFGLATIRRNSQQDPEVALVVNDAIHLLSSLEPNLGSKTLKEMLQNWQTNLPLLQALTESTTENTSIPSSSCTFETPIQYPSKLLAVGANYTSHLKEMGLPAKKWDPMPFFSCPPTTSIDGPGQTVKMPTGTKEFDWECELTVVIGSRLSHASVEEAEEGIAGYTIGLDLSCRDLLHSGPVIDLMRGKAQEGMKPCGPLFWSKECVGDVRDMDVRLWVDDEIMIDWNTKEMIWSPVEAVAEISKYLPLEAGDMVMTGTPAGSAKSHGSRWLKIGDRIKAEIGGLGGLEVEVVER